MMGLQQLDTTNGDWSISISSLTLFLSILERVVLNIDMFIFAGALSLLKKKKKWEPKNLFWGECCMYYF